MGKKLEDKNLLATQKKHSYPTICGALKLKKFKELSKIDLELQNFKNPLSQINEV